MEQEKTTIQAAAKALNVTPKTIQRYLTNGTLTKIKEGTRTYALIEEVRTLRQGQNQGQKKPVQTSTRDRDINTITLKLSEYKELLQEVGHFKGILEGQTRHLIEYKADIEEKNRAILDQQETIKQKDMEISTIGETLTNANSELRKLVKIKQDAEQKAKALLEVKNKAEEQNKILKEAGDKIRELQSELDRAKLPWWRRWIGGR